MVSSKQEIMRRGTPIEREREWRARHLQSLAVQFPELDAIVRPAPHGVGQPDDARFDKRSPADRAGGFDLGRQPLTPHHYHRNSLLASQQCAQEEERRPAGVVASYCSS